MPLCFYQPEDDRSTRKTVDKNGSIYENKHFIMTKPSSHGLFSRLKGTYDCSLYLYMNINTCSCV